MGMFWFLFLAFCRIYAADQLTDDANIMRFMWTTPVQTISLLSSVTDGQKLLRNLENDLVSFHHAFRGSNPVVATASTFSDTFYRHQQAKFVEYKKCLLLKRDLKSCSFYLPSSVAALVPLLISKIEIYLRECMIQEEGAGEVYGEATAKEQLFDTINDPLKYFSSLFVWTSVHLNGSLHDPHHHKNSAISGVIYVTVPSGSGDIVFYDPRGSLPPFGKTLRLQPSPGTLVLFPSWLVHSVQPTLSSKPRISLSFNLDGDWETTSDVNSAFFVQG
jgi:hypothetical protein